jgi:hypothetical protein
MEQKLIIKRLKICLVIFIISFLGLFLLDFLKAFVEKICVNMGRQGPEFFCGYVYGPWPEGITDVMHYIPLFELIINILEKIFEVVYPFALVGSFLFGFLYLINRKKK